MSFDLILLIIASLLLLSVFASRISDRLGVPALLLFLIIGMLAGSDGIGGIYFDNASLAKSVGVLALIFILFSGGFDTQWKDVRSIFQSGLSLATVGVLITALLVGTFAVYVLKFTLWEGLLLGAIVSSTDAAAVFNVMRTRNIGLQGKLRPLLEFESGSNDPMAVFLTVGILGIITHGQFNLSFLAGEFLLNMGLGVLLGFVLGRLIVIVINRLDLAYEGLYPVLMIALALLVYALTTLLKGNGFLAVYIAGLVAGNSRILHKKSFRQFNDGIAWLMQIIMFLVLGLLVFPSQLPSVAEMGLLLSLFLILLARPISVFISLAFSHFNWREKLMLSWVGLRGAVPIILATFPLLEGIPQANIIFNIVFFVVLTSIILQGTTIAMIAKWLKVDAPLNKQKAYPIEFDNTGVINTELSDVLVPYTSWAVGKSLLNMKLPDACLVVLISRGDQYVIPRGLTLIEGGDVLLVLASAEALRELNMILQNKHSMNN